MRNQDILDYMDASIKNAESCLKILETLGAYTADNQKTIDAMIATRTTFQAISHVEDIASQLSIPDDEFFALM